MSQTSVLDYVLHISVKKGTKVALEIMAKKDRRSLNAYARMVLEDHIRSLPADQSGTPGPVMGLDPSSRDQSG